MNSPGGRKLWRVDKVDYVTTDQSPPKRQEFLPAFHACTRRQLQATDSSMISILYPFYQLVSGSESTQSMDLTTTFGHTKTVVRRGLGRPMNKLNLYPCLLKLEGTTAQPW